MVFIYYYAIDSAMARVVFLLLLAISAMRAAPSASTPVKHALAAALRSALPPRPRLLLTDDRLRAVAAFVANSSQAASWYRNLTRQGDWILSVAPKAVPTPGNTDALGAARESLQRIYATGLLWRLTGNTSFADRCLREAVNVVAWSDWCVDRDSLVTAELQHAAAIALDWLDGYFGDAPGGAAARTAIVTGILTLGQSVMLEGYTAVPPPSWANPNTFLNATNCYGVVVNSGALLGSLGLLGEPGIPAWVHSVVLPSALLQLDVAMRSFAPAGDGSWYEGPNYALYNARYLAPAIGSLQSALGSDFGLLGYPGLESMADAFAYSLTPTFTSMNWADTDEVLETSVANLPFAGAPGVAFIVRDMVDAVGTPASETGDNAMQASAGLLYYSSRGTADDRAALPLDR